ncbi:hypothetical protein O1611_g628 [Lasiodiplodia mahajangana]|uniref:Uncharacterized protein n=1 Tax=Lasiodiplodia mahajangana TaxID=1108764 RepID=A0ACC2K0K4_9PEZI|nr:hypothetical protein O1611_g628 [Lasiodiplodia mahajangana]
MFEVEQPVLEEPGVGESRVGPTTKVRGFKLASIDTMWDLAVQGNIPTSWLRATKWGDAEKQPPEELWRTLVADRTAAGLDTDPGYSSIIQFAAREKGIEYGINTNELLHEKDNSAYFEVFRRVQAVVWNRKLIRADLDDDVTARLTARRRSLGNPLGLVPAETEREDLIYIVIGCSVPLVLRERPGDTYTLVGECYINNLMDGLAIDGLPADECDIITIE